jgi:WD repeat and SOF domain-containing protein 1
VTGRDNSPSPTGGDHNSKEKGNSYNWGDDPRDFRDLDWSNEGVEEDERDLSWATVLKRTFEAFLRGERPNMYGEWINWEEEEEY